MASRIPPLLQCVHNSSPSSLTMTWASHPPIKLLLDLVDLQACLLEAIHHQPAHGRVLMQKVPHQCRRPGRPSSRDSSPSTFCPLSRLPQNTRLKSLLPLLPHPLKRYLPNPDSPAASVSSCSPPVPIIWHVQHAGHICLLTSSWMRTSDASQVRHKKPKAKPAAQPPMEALQPFEQRQRQQQLQQAAAPAAAEPEYRHVPPPPPPPPPPQPEAPQPPAAFDSKPAPWAHKRAAATPGTSLPHLQASQTFLLEAPCLRASGVLMQT